MKTIIDIRNKIAALESLAEKTDQFVQDVFDWTATLGHNHILGQLYDLKADIDIELKKLREAEDNE